MLNNNKLILIFGFNEEEVDFLDRLRAQENLPEIRVISREMASMKIKDIIDGLKFEIYGINLPDEKVMIFNNLSDEELDRTLKVIRGSIKARPIMAVVTPTSIDWEFRYLLEHLIEEREWVKANAKRGINGE
jgi:hypothetical protein